MSVLVHFQRKTTILWTKYLKYLGCYKPSPMKGQTSYVLIRTQTYKIWNSIKYTTKNLLRWFSLGIVGKRRRYCPLPINPYRMLQLRYFKRWEGNGQFGKFIVKHICIRSGTFLIRREAYLLLTHLHSYPPPHTKTSYGVFFTQMTHMDCIYTSWIGYNWFSSLWLHGVKWGPQCGPLEPVSTRQASSKGGGHAGSWKS